MRNQELYAWRNHRTIQWVVYLNHASQVAIFLISFLTLLPLR
uniref:DUF2214 domain-containing protein n=1 Tax=Elaeophora elaphi TaxID=1147741 RepID=A0A0R3RID8_9BILA